VKRIAIVGTESSGKSTLAERLARRFHTTWVPEYGRFYCEHRDARTLQMPDLEAILWGQATWEDDAADSAQRLLVCDTELHTTCTWADLTLGYRLPWMTAAARARHYDLILLLDHDLPWRDDGVRVLSGRREEHTALLRAELDSAGRTYHVIRGAGAEREARAAALVEALRSEP
jgi:NadR type nicotinamide-nucleotide adenylyltransferase